MIRCDAADGESIVEGSSQVAEKPGEHVERDELCSRFDR